MARKKTEVEAPQVENPTEEQIEDAVQTTIEDGNAQQEGDGIVEQPAEEPVDQSGEAEKEADAKDETTVESEVAETQATVEGDEIPGHIQRILKSFPGYEKLYVDAAGGVFTEGTKPSERGAAILYRNPFFSNKQ